MMIMMIMMRIVIMKLCILTFKHLDSDSGDLVVSFQTIRRGLNNLPESPRAQDGTWKTESREHEEEAGERKAEESDPQFEG